MRCPQCDSVDVLTGPVVTSKLTYPKEHYCNDCGASWDRAET